MGVSAAVTVAATVATAVQGADDARRARHTAEANAQKQADALAALKGEPAPVIPVADSKAVNDAKRRSIADQMRRRGRSSTILTGGNDTGASDALGS